MSNSPNPEPDAALAAGMPDATVVDPYTELLHLAPGDRPPHLYQVLEIEIFCPHPEQIEHAVRNQFRKIKPFEDHPDRGIRERIQDVMTHIATARTVLTDPEQKQRYDEMLATHLKVDRDEILRGRTAARPPEFAMRVIGGPRHVGARLELLPDRPVTVGKDPHCTLMLPGARMEPLHAQLEHLDNAWVLRPTETSPTLLVNNQRCEEFLLADNDVIDLGGYRLHFERLGVHRGTAISPPPPISLVVREGPSIPEPRFDALPPTSILIGHCDTALWQLAGAMVSRHHARIEPVGGLWEITDLHSTNGTELNGERITQSALKHRDQLVIGQFEIQVSLRR